MAQSVSTEKRIEIFFKTLTRGGARSSLPPAGKLTEEFERIYDQSDKKDENEFYIEVNPKQSALLATAAVEIWQRAVHSFLVSVSTTEASPIWSAVSGYYASHYSVRGLAHLLGHYQLYRKKRNLSINIINGKSVCSFLKKRGTDREHKYYWNIVNSDPSFAMDPFFTTNPENQTPSDIANRSKANYLDHLNNFPNFAPLEPDNLKNHIESLSAMELSDVPIPRRENCPDVINVQLVAYHRIHKFRKFLDGILGGKNNFWNVHREPSWSRRFIDFQVVDADFATARGHQI